LESSVLPSRKADHIRICLEEDVASGLSTGLEKFYFNHQALPEINLEDIDMGQELYGRVLKIPLLISSMTGGTEGAAAINQSLAEAAQEFGIAMGVGSQRTALEYPKHADTFHIRRYAPDALLFANLGAVQLNYGYTLDHCERAVDMIEADGLFLHLNCLQEALQPEGETHFADLLAKIESICHKLSVPVIVKEIGNGISGELALKLADVGVKAIDVAGAGGTSWSQVEMHRIKEQHLSHVAEAFRTWGIPTAESIKQVKRVCPDLVIFGSGGLRTGIDVAKCIALGTVLGGMAAPFLEAVITSREKLFQKIEEINREIRLSMFMIGAGNIDELRHTPMLRSDSGGE
jgi:isopentenyl-diphosphate Delta-isomerase